LPEKFRAIPGGTKMTNYCAFLSDQTLSIYLLHGVVDKNSYKVRNYTRKHLEKDYFYSILKELKRSGHPISMDEVVDCHLSGKPYPANAFAITFDDGFENNYSVAAPILKDLGIPATFYITTGFIQNNAMSWIDRIEHCLEHTQNVLLRLPWSDVKHTIKNPEDAIHILNIIRNTVKNNPDIDINTLVSNIYDQCGLEGVCQSSDPLDKKMTWDQIRLLNDDESFTIGGHTHSHAILSFLNAKELRNEISQSLGLLKEKSCVFTKHYSYPEGLAYCYSDSVIEELQNHGIVCSPTAMNGVNHFQNNLFHLKRIMVT
jgi:peptidoglycan/xylan/chitin deacetylase (PgdA/CDA1 family)